MTIYSHWHIDEMLSWQPFLSVVCWYNLWFSTVIGSVNMLLASSVHSLVCRRLSIFSAKKFFSFRYERKKTFICLNWADCIVSQPASQSVDTLRFTLGGYIHIQFFICLLSSSSWSSLTCLVLYTYTTLFTLLCTENKFFSLLPHTTLSKWRDDGDDDHHHQIYLVGCLYTECSTSQSTPTGDTVVANMMIVNIIWKVFVKNYLIISLSFY